MINLRAIFGRCRVEYRDKGPNTSRGHVNIKCCWCVDDPSFHLAINLETGEYYCYRNPKHGGHSLPALFKKLGLPYETYKDLKGDYTQTVRIASDQNDYSLWRYFTPAEQNQEALDYLASRKFLDPISIARKFNLKVALEGEWAGRLLIPLTIGWTGRSIRKHIEPRYKAFTSEDGFYFYGQNSSSAIVVEGAIDSMRIASVTNQFDLYAKCRIPLSASMYLQMREKKYQSIYSAPDSTVTFLQARDEMAEIRSYCTGSWIGRIQIPEKDFGECSESQTRALLRSVGYDSNLAVLR